MPSILIKTFLATAAAAVAALIVVGCGETSTPTSTPQTDENAKPLMFGFLPPPPVKSGAQLWGENCNRCHIARSPSLYSTQEWEIIGHHMRLLPPHRRRTEEDRRVHAGRPLNAPEATCLRSILILKSSKWSRRTTPAHDRPSNPRFCAKDAALRPTAHGCARVLWG